MIKCVFVRFWQRQSIEMKSCDSFDDENRVNRNAKSEKGEN